MRDARCKNGDVLVILSSLFEVFPKLAFWMFNNVGRWDFRIFHKGAIQEHVLLRSNIVSAVECLYSKVMEVYK
jgi:hypothetical protein